MSGRRKFVAAVALALVGLGAVASSASATFHLMKIREVSSGTGTADSSYVEIQMYFDFQSFLSNGAKLVRCDATCSSPTTFAPFTNVANGRSQDTVLFADSGIGSGSKDFNVNLNLDSIQAGGAVCYLSEPGFADCVSWGNFSADSDLMANYGTTAGMPAAALVSGMALRRSIAPGCSTMLGARRRHEQQLGGLLADHPGPPLELRALRPRCHACLAVAEDRLPPTPTTPAAPSPSKKKCKTHKHRSAQAAKKCKKHK